MMNHSIPENLRKYSACVHPKFSDEFKHSLPAKIIGGSWRRGEIAEHSGSSNHPSQWKANPSGYSVMGTPNTTLMRHPSIALYGLSRDRKPDHCPKISGRVMLPLMRRCRRSNTFLLLKQSGIQGMISWRHPSLGIFLTDCVFLAVWSTLRISRMVGPQGKRCQFEA
jgi:hypothetical protein